VFCYIAITLDSYSVDMATATNKLKV